MLTCDVEARWAGTVILASVVVATTLRFSPMRDLNQGASGSAAMQARRKNSHVTRWVISCPPRRGTVAALGPVMRDGQGLGRICGAPALRNHGRHRGTIVKPPRKLTPKTRALLNRSQRFGTRLRVDQSVCNPSHTR